MTFAELFVSNYLTSKKLAAPNKHKHYLQHFVLAVEERRKIVLQHSLPHQGTS